MKTYLFLVNVLNLLIKQLAKMKVSAPMKSVILLLFGLLFSFQVISQSLSFNVGPDTISPGDTLVINNTSINIPTGASYRWSSLNGFETVDGSPGATLHSMISNDSTIKLIVVRNLLRG